MISRIKNIYANFQFGKSGTINNDSASVSSAPGIIEEPTYVEIIDTNPPSEFGQVDKQRHFGILHYTVTKQFRKLMLIALVNLVLLAGFFLFVFFLIVHLEKKHEDIHTTTRTLLDHTGCSPNQKSIFFFAYSNDLTADQVLNTWKSISVNSNLFLFESFALGRFDKINNINNIFSTSILSDNISGIYGALRNNLPNLADSFEDPSEGSDVLDIIDSFFDRDATYCGATLFILTKRLPPTDTSISYISYLVSMLKKYHAHVTFVVSENSFGGPSPEPMYRLASETNGVCIFTEDDNIQKTPLWLPSTWPSYLVYSFNAKVTNTGTVTLPNFNSPLVGYYYICMTLQDHGRLDKFRMVHLEWNNNESSNSGSFVETLESHAAIYGNTTYIRKGPYILNAVPYNMKLGFEYLDGNTEVLQIRIYSVSAVDFWVPYAS